MANLRRERVQDSVPTVDRLEWQAPLQVIKYPHPTLRAPNSRIGCFDDSLLRLAEEMKEVMYRDDGVGLAAPQVGLNLRLMVFNPLGDIKRKDMEIILVNPEIVTLSKKVDLAEEGCLSFPGLYGDVQRSLLVKVRAQDETGQPIKMAFKDWVARIFQHEYDHLEGTLFPDRMSPEQLTEARDQLAVFESAYEEAHPNTPYRRIG